ncbi:type II toxin-antitoxin system HicB family antitoxin [bacterium]|nr:type II toxin-antitoxin system HicB family antitoxin [bacterium]
MRFRLVVAEDRETGRWSAVFPEIPGCGSAGDSEREAVRNARQALALWFKPSKIKLPGRAKVLAVSAA